MATNFLEHSFEGRRRPEEFQVHPAIAVFSSPDEYAMLLQCSAFLQGLKQRSKESPFHLADICGIISSSLSRHDTNTAFLALSHHTSKRIVRGPFDG